MVLEQGTFLLQDIKSLKEEEAKVGKDYPHKPKSPGSISKFEHFAFVNKFGKRFFTASFILVYLKLPISYSKDLLLGIKVSKKFSKSAVIRNKTKRKIRHLVRENISFPYGLHIICIPKKELLTSRFKSLKKDFIKFQILLNHSY